MTFPSPLHLNTRPRLVLCALVCLALTLFAFSPRLWLMRGYLPGTFQWDRAHSFLLQCEHPFRHDVEPAMLWRLLPPLVAHTAHLPGYTPLVLPFLGVFALTLYVAVLLRRRQSDPRAIFGGTLLVTTTSAVLVPLHWFGMNDAWVWLGLLAVAFGRAPWALPLACLLCPWIDERFIIGFPLAWTVRCLDRHEPLFNRFTWTALFLLPYAALRLWLSRHSPAGHASTEFFLSILRSDFALAPLVPLGWWMGLRLGWGLVACGLWFAPHGQRALGALTLFATLVISWLLAADLSRSVAIALPFVLLGSFALVEKFPVHAPRTLLLLGLASLIIPAAHLTFNKTDLIGPLPLELFRLLRPSTSLL